MVKVTVDWKNLSNNPTIHTALRDKLGREPTHAELVNEVDRILHGRSLDDMTKTPGQVAYEVNVAEFPDYPTIVGGGPRPAWSELSDPARMVWEREAQYAAPCEKQRGEASSRKGG